MQIEFTPNQKLLLQGTPFLLNPKGLQKLQCQIEQKGVNWQSLIEDAYMHGVLPVIQKHLQELEWKGVPESSQVAINEKVEEIAKNNFRLSGELVKILDVFQQHNIKNIPVKGPSLAGYLYGDIRMRQYFDLDILVKKEDVLKTENLLTSMGYKAAISLSPKQKVKYIENECEYNFVHQVSNMIVEIHWNFVPRYIGFFRNYEYYEKNHCIHNPTNNVPYICDEEMCLALLVHNGLKHGFDRLGWYMDILAIWSRESFDWNKFLILARESGFNNLVSLAVENVKNLFDFRLIDSVQFKIQSPLFISEQSHRLNSRLFKRIHKEPGLWEQSKYHLSLREGVRRKLYYLVKLVLSPNSFDWNWISLPDKMYLLYYVLRPVRLINKALKNYL